MKTMVPNIFLVLSVIFFGGILEVWSGNPTTATIEGRAPAGGGLKTYKTSRIEDIKKDVVAPEGKITQGEIVGRAADLGKLPCASSVKALEEKMNLKNLVSIIWKKVNADTFCVKDIFLTPIEGSSNICPDVSNYLKQLEGQKSPDKMAVVLLELDSEPYTKLYGPGTIFSFSDWYRLFQNVYTNKNYQGNNFKVKEEWVDNQGDHAKIQNITITWGAQKNIAQVDIATLKSGAPYVWLHQFNPDGNTLNPVCEKKKTAPKPH